MIRNIEVSKLYDFTTWEINNCNTHIAQSLRKQKQSGNEIWPVNKIKQTFFLKNYAKNVVEKLVIDPFLKNQN